MGLAGVFAAEEEDWRRLRRIVASALSTARLTRFFPELARDGERLRRRWERTADHGEAIDPCGDHMRFTARGRRQDTRWMAVASQKAQERGVGHLVEFLEGDLMNLPFADESFDAALNHESFCYADDKPAYLQGVYRVLKPGGRWQALDAELLSDAPMSEKHQALVDAVERNWRLPSLPPWRDVLAMA